MIPVSACESTILPPLRDDDTCKSAFQAWPSAARQAKLLMLFMS